jgi:hypothetical protein
MSDIFVIHDTVEDHAVFNHTSRNLLDLGISFDIDFNVTVGILLINSSYSFDCEVNKEISPLGREFSSDGGFNDFDQIIIVFEIDFNLWIKNIKIKKGALTPSSLVILTISSRALK